MKGGFCSLIVLCALLTSGCGIKLFTNKINIECAQDNLATSTPPSLGKDGRLIDQDELPSRSLDKEQPSDQSTLFMESPHGKNSPGASSRSSFVVPVANMNSTSSSCLTDDKEVLATAQATSVWCWAASAEAVMKFHTNSPNKSQCNIVNTILKAGDPSGPNSNAFCCNDNLHRDCQKNGLPSRALTTYGFEWRLVYGPLKREKLAAQLCEYGPVIFILRYAGGGGHSFVVGGYEYDNRHDEFYLLVHDHSWVSTDKDVNELTPVPYMRWPYKDYVEGRWNGKLHEHYANYVSIKPPAKR